MALTVTSGGQSGNGCVTSISLSSNSLQKVGGGAITTYGYQAGASNPPTGTYSQGSTQNSTASWSSTFSPAYSGTWYMRAYAYNSGFGYSYGAVRTFTVYTKPVLTSTTPSSITITGCTTGGNVSSAGGQTVTSRGIQWGINGTTFPNQVVIGSGIGTFSAAITGLPEGTLIYMRAYAVNSCNTAYGIVLQFTTLSRPTITTTTPSNVLSTTLTTGGNIISQGSSVVTDRGVCYSRTNATPTTADLHTHNSSGSGIFTSNLTGLTIGATYYIRAYAINTAGTQYGTVQTIMTAPTLTGGTDTVNFPFIGWSGITQVCTWSGTTSQRWYHKISTDPAYTLVGTYAKVTGNTHQKIDLKPNINYSFYSTYYKTGLESPPSNIVTINNTVALPLATFSSTLIV